MISLSCKSNESNTANKLKESVLKYTSEELKNENHLIPLLDKRRWNLLLELEKNEKDYSEFKSLYIKLKESNKYTEHEDYVQLGDVILILKDGSIWIDCKIHFPEHEIIEVILSNSFERIHETLLTTAARPAHLEALMHYAGYKHGTQFNIFISDGFEKYPIEEYLEIDGYNPDKMLWKFNGGNFIEDKYGPDFTGDLILSFYSQECVLISADSQIEKGITELKAAKSRPSKQGQLVRLIIEHNDKKNHNINKSKR